MLKEGNFCRHCGKKLIPENTLIGVMGWYCYEGCPE